MFFLVVLKRHTFKLSVELLSGINLNKVKVISYLNKCGFITRTILFLYCKSRSSRFFMDILIAPPSLNYCLGVSWTIPSPHKVHIDH